MTISRPGHTLQGLSSCRRRQEFPELRSPAGFTTGLKVGTLAAL